MSSHTVQTVGTAKQWIREGKQAVKMTRLNCHRFLSNEVRLWLSVIAYNVGNLWRRLVLPKRIDHWLLTSLQQRMVKTGGRLIKHARYCWLLLAEGHLTRRLFGVMLQRIPALPSPAGQASRGPDQTSVTREEEEGNVSEDWVATAAVAGCGTLGWRRTGLARAAGSTPAPRSRRERCMRRRSDLH